MNKISYDRGVASRVTAFSPLRVIIEVAIATMIIGFCLRYHEFVKIDNASTSHSVEQVPINVKNDIEE